MKAKKRACIGDIVNEFLADNPHIEPVNINSKFTPDLDSPTFGVGTYYIQAWFKYRVDG